VTVEQALPELRHSPLDSWRAGSPDCVLLTEVPFLAMVNLRVDPAGPLAGRIAAALGVELPTEPNTVAASGATSVLWLGPDEWLVVGADGAAPGLVEVLRGVLAGARGSAVDVSANRTTIEISGRHARDVLEQGCPVDLHPRAFAPGRCVQTMLARAQVVLWRPGGGSGGAGRDGSDYLAAWLTDAAAEYRGDTR
jgi:sarcosine oxidase, subunit gamma